ncbi:hypothetical protein DFH07DRAFT_951782 [Mycena maculata]|uniref:F-box domain-containing protein n=1 Tax=Mycena maculata TaxID=230809 RepID=A0AAD7K418_9AGAR|nr:hypothetical protein DFH07DRAFT_951782 [Mycena maculata]
MLPPEMYLEIALQSDLATLLCLTRLNKSFDGLIRPFIYRDIIVSRRAKKLVRALGDNDALVPMIVSLVFDYTGRRVHLPESEWNRALLRMCNLKHLVISQGVPLARETVLRLPFRLTSFGARCTVVGAWAELVASQTTLEILFLEAGFVAPEMPILPRLASLRAKPAEVARFMESPTLVNVWLWSGSPNPGQAGLTSPEILHLGLSPSRLLTIRLGAGQLCLLLSEAPTVLSTVEHIAIDEDDDWWSFGYLPTAMPNRLRGVGAGLDTRFPQLRTLMFISEMNPEDIGNRCIWGSQPWGLAPQRDSRLVADIGLMFARALRPLCTVPRLRTFHFCAFDGCLTLKKWGGIDEELRVTDWEEHSVWDLEECS